MHVSRSPVSRSPVSRSPVSRSPASRSPASRSPASRSRLVLVLAIATVVLATLAGLLPALVHGAGPGLAQQPARPLAAPRSYRSVRIAGVPHVLQRPDFCGEACAEMALRRLGHRVTQDQVFAVTGVDPALGRGAVTRELAAGLRRLGFELGPVWYNLAAGASLRPELEAQFGKLHADLVAGVPSIVCTHFDSSPGTTEHFRLVTGYDAARDEVIYHDPAEARGGYLKMKRSRFLSLWPLAYGRTGALVIRMPLQLKQLVAPPRSTTRHSPADFAQHVMKLRGRLARLPGRFTVVVEPPFVVAGDEWQGDVRRRARQRVRWAVQLLKQDFFTRDPDQILDIFLFKDRASYLRGTRALVGGKPGTPFGFYSPRARGLFMNISTGEGTLVHELVHPFMEAACPAPPPWINEGLGSLYEMVGQKQGHIWGYPNWRLPALQRTIRAKALPPFTDLIAADEHVFYEEDPGSNYAQARYLFYYLQERGLLPAFFKAYLKGLAQDPTGLATLKRTLGITDLAAFQVQWEKFVLGLRYPP